MRFFRLPDSDFLPMIGLAGISAALGLAAALALVALGSPELSLSALMP